jgi:hypothetical protein
MAYTSTTTANSVTTTCTIASDISVHPSTRTMPHVLTESMAHISGMDNLNSSSVIFLPTIVNNQIHYLRFCWRQSAKPITKRSL